MSYLHWHVGMKVVCVAALPWDTLYHLDDDILPVKGGTYTIREIGRWHPKYPDHVTIRLVQCPNRPGVRRGVAHPIELFFFAKEFKPLDRRATDISLFQRMLTGNKQKVEA